MPQASTILITTSSTKPPKYPVTSPNPVPTTTPVVRIHPVTKKKALFVNTVFTTHIEGLNKPESDAILAMLYAHIATPEFQCRFHWRPNSMALWDNRATMHYAVADYWPERRLMNRVTIETDEVGVGKAVVAE